MPVFMDVDEHEARTSRAAALLVRVVLAPRSMVVMDTAVLLLGAMAMTYAVLRFLNILGPQSFIQDCDFTLDVFDGIADVFVFYGVALESRPHLAKSTLAKEAGGVLSVKLDGVSEHTGIYMVVLGLMLEMTSQFGKLAGDLNFSEWLIVFPLCAAGFVIVGIALQQLLFHLISVVKALRRAGRE